MKILRFTSSSKLLNRILADPALPDRIRKLEASALARLIEQVGLEDCSEIIALTTTAQLQQVFDLDLWRNAQPGGDEAFDAQRFGLWLEILLELGPTPAAERITEMDRDFVTMAISQMIWVVRFDELRTLVTNETRLDKIIDSSNTYEIEDYYLFARQPESWDAVLTILVELDREHHSFLVDILESCSHLTTGAIEEEGGLYSVLTSEEQLKSDVAFEREKRREALGFVTPADARAFLILAQGSIDAEDHVSPKRFRDFGTPSSSAPATNRNSLKTDIVHSSDPRFACVQSMFQRDPSLTPLYMEELNYLANVLISGGQASRPGEAAEAVLKTCESGLRKRELRSLIEAFRAGWGK